MVDVKPKGDTCDTVYNIVCNGSLGLTLISIIMTHIRFRVDLLGVLVMNSKRKQDSRLSDSFMYAYGRTSMLSSYIRTIPMTLYGANLASWDGSMGGGNTTFNNLMKASGCKYFRIPGGSWGNGHLWSDIEGPNGSQGWKVSYAEYLYLMSLISQPGEEVPPTLQPIVNFPGWWYDQCQDNNPTDDVCDWAQAHPAPSMPRLPGSRTKPPEPFAPSTGKSATKSAARGKSAIFLKSAAPTMATILPIFLWR